MANSKTESMKIRQTRVRRSLKNSGRPRLSVFRSNKHIYAQIIDDVNQKTLVSVSTVSKEVKGKISKTSDIKAATEIGKLIGQLAKKANVAEVAFDRGSYLYHGKVKALADAARSEGLKF